MKKKVGIILAIVIPCLLIALGIGAWLGWQNWNETYIKLGKETLRRDVTALDLCGQKPDTEVLTQLPQLKKLDATDNGMTVQEHEQLCQLLPDCEITWSVPFQGGYLPNDTAKLTVTEFTADDAAMLQYFPQLTAIDATGCTANETLLQLRSEGKLQVDYTVTVGGKSLALDTSELTLENVNADELAAALPHLKQLKTVTLNGALPSQDVLCTWKATYPETIFVWSFEVFGVPVTSLSTELILNDIPMTSTDEIDKAMAAFYNMEKVEMCHCGISNEDMWALRQRHPETKFVWMVLIGYKEIRTDITTFMPYKLGYGEGGFGNKHAANLRYCTDIIVMDIGHMGVTDYSFMEHMTKMEYLILADTKGTDFSVIANMKELKYLEVFITKFDQAEVLTGLTKLVDLNIGTSLLDNIEPLTRMPWLENLWLPATPYVSMEERAQLAEALPNTRIVYGGIGSTDLGWRETPNYYKMRDLLGMAYSPGYTSRSTGKND